MAKNSFVLYKDQCAGLENLSDEDAGKFFKHIIRYQLHGEIPQFFSGFEATLFNLFRSQFDRDAEKYAQECEKKAENGKKGGLARASKCLQVSTDAGKSKQLQPDNDNDNENDIIKEKINKKKNSTSKPSGLEEVKAYAQEIELAPEQAEAFYDHFESNGWKVGGKTPMKDWKAAMRNWKRNVRPAIPILSANPGTSNATTPPAERERPTKRQMLFYALNHKDPLYKVNLSVFTDYQEKNGWPGDWRQKLHQWYLRCMENENNPARRFLTLVDYGDAIGFREFAGAGTGQVQIHEIYGIRLPLKKSEYKQAV